MRARFDDGGNERKPFKLFDSDMPQIKTETSIGITKSRTCVMEVSLDSVTVTYRLLSIVYRFYRIKEATGISLKFHGS